MTPRTRRKAALIFLVVSLVLGHVNVGAVLLGWMDHETMDLVTNYLSWLAITLTMLDVVFTADVRVEQEAGTDAT